MHDTEIRCRKTAISKTYAKALAVGVDSTDRKSCDAGEKKMKVDDSISMSPITASGRRPLYHDRRLSFYSFLKRMYIVKK